MFLVGGESGCVDETWSARESQRAALESLRCLNCTTCTLTDLKPMHVARTGLGAGVLRDGRIYAFGGFDGSVLHGCVEVYDVREDTWTMASHVMNTARSHFGYCTLRGGEHLLAAGGIGSSAPATSAPSRSATEVVALEVKNGQPLASVELFTLSTRSWTFLPPLPHPRSHTSACMLATAAPSSTPNLFMCHVQVCCTTSFTSWAGSKEQPHERSIRWRCWTSMLSP
jgi:hypothetical protein